MRLLPCLAAMILAASSCTIAWAEEITFVGKTYSPNHMEVLSLHATPEELKVFDTMAKEMKQKLGEGADPPVKPFTGRMKVIKMMADIGHKVDLEQHLLEYAFPPEDLLSERRKVSQADIKSLEASLESVRSDVTSKRKKLEEARLRHSRGLSSDQDVSDMTKDLDLAKLKERTLDDNLRFEREMAKGELDLAKAKFGAKTTDRYIPGISWINTPVAGYVLWVNPEVKPGVILTKKTKLFVVGSMDPILIRALVHEIQLPKLRVGDKAKVVFDTLPEKTFEASIIRIPMTANQTDVQLPSHFEVELSLPNPDLFLKEGMRGQVTVQIPDGPR
jgi:hypothetical protein